MNELDFKKAEQFFKAVQMFAESLSDEKALEIATIYEPWVAGKSYKGGDRFTYGTNDVGDPQLYRVNDGKDHVSQLDWLPDKEPSLYTPIGLNDEGYPVWAKPTGAHDAYNTGDIVDHEGTLYESQINGNTTVPGTDERYWKVYNKSE